MKICVIIRHFFLRCILVALGSVTLSQCPAFRQHPAYWAGLPDQIKCTVALSPSIFLPHVAVTQNTGTDQVTPPYVQLLALPKPERNHCRRAIKFVARMTQLFFSNPLYLPMQLKIGAEWA
jgi:hypothetical protein